MCKFISLLNGNIASIDDVTDFAEVIKSELGEEAYNCFKEMIPDKEEYDRLDRDYEELLEESTLQENKINELENENESLKAQIERLEKKLDNKNDLMDDDDDLSIPLF